MSANIVMNTNKYLVTREVGKIDELFSYAGGLFGLIMGFISFCMMSFNEQRYEIRVAEGMFNLMDEANRVREKDLHFFKYLKYSTYDWINTFCCCGPNWKDCQEIDKTREEVNSQMDVSLLFRKIRSLENSLEYLLSKQERDCLALIEPPSIDKIRNDRLILDYYHAVIQGQASLTIEDIKNMKKPDSLDLSQPFEKGSQTALN